MAQINFDQLVQSLGYTGAAAESLARSLQSASNSADRNVSALNSESTARSRVTQQTRTFGDQIASTADTLISLSGQIISTAEGLSTTNTVFTQITPLVSKITEITRGVGSLGVEIGTIIGTLKGGPAGGAIGALVGKLFGNALGAMATLAGEVFNQYLQQGEKVMGAFNSLSNVGVTFGGSLKEMQDIISKTGMPLEMLAKVAQGNAENLALLGGGVSGALENVANAARNKLGPELVTLYGGFASLGDELVDYLAMERRRGVQQDLLSENNIESTKAYLYQLKEISALTGKSSKQLKQEIEQRSRNAATQSMLSKMSDTQRKQYDAAMLKVPDAVKGPLQDAFLAFSRGMEPVSTEFLQLQAAAPEAAESIRRMAMAANKGPEEFNRVMDQESKNLTVSAGKLTEQMGDLFYLQQAGRLSSSLVDTLNKVITDINSNAGRLKTMGEDSAKFAEQTASLASNASVFTTSIASVYAAQANLAIKLNGIVLGTEGSEQKLTTFANTVTYVTDVMSDFVEGLDDIINYITGFNNPREQRISAQNEKINVVKSEIEDQKRARYDLMRQSLGPSQTIDDNTAVPDDIKRQIGHIDRSIEQRLRRLESLERGIQNISEQEDAREAAKRQKQREMELEEQNKKMSLGDKPLPVVSPPEEKLSINFEPLRDMLQPSLNSQTLALQELVKYMDSQGGQIKRVVDRMAT